MTATVKQKTINMRCNLTKSIIPFLIAFFLGLITQAPFASAEVVKVIEYNFNIY